MNVHDSDSGLYNCHGHSEHYGDFNETAEVLVASKIIYISVILF